eukprot:6017113-Alexandrium_andersonii.AAC.1
MVTQCAPSTEEFACFQKRGRVQLLLAHVGAPVPVRIINMYCYSRGHAQASAREQTIALVSAILAEVEQ